MVMSIGAPVGELPFRHQDSPEAGVDSSSGCASAMLTVSRDLGPTTATLCAKLFEQGLAPVFPANRAPIPDWDAEMSEKVNGRDRQLGRAGDVSGNEVVQARGMCFWVVDGTLVPLTEPSTVSAPNPSPTLSLPNRTVAWPSAPDSCGSDDGHERARCPRPAANTVFSTDIVNGEVKTVDIHSAAVT